MIEVELHITEQEIEEDRQHDLKDTIINQEKTEQELREQYCNTYGYREALHLSFVQHEIVLHYLAKHPAITLDPQAYRYAYIAAMALFELYQRIGNLECDSENVD